MASVDPTYPFYPIACVLSVVMLLLVLLSNFARQSWNLGVTFLCFWIMLENLTYGINAIIWVDNADLKFYVYCDIVSHLQLITFTVKPMATLIIIRRLYLIANLQSVEPPGKVARRRYLAMECFLGLAVPAIVAGPLFQAFRFEVQEGFGCANSTDGSILSMLLLNSWSVIPPLVSITVYHPKVARMFYRQSRDIDHFLQSSDSVTRTNYIRILVLASVDIILTLPMATVSVVLTVTTSLSFYDSPPFYLGWSYNRTRSQEPIGFSYADLAAKGTFDVVQFYFIRWSTLVLAFAIFGLFGITSEARASYWRFIHAIGGWFGCKPTPRASRSRSPWGNIEFGERPMDLETRSQPSYINPDERVPEQVANVEDGQTTSKRESGSNLEMDAEITGVPRHVLDDTGDLDSRHSDDIGRSLCWHGVEGQL